MSAKNTLWPFTVLDYERAALGAMQGAKTTKGNAGESQVAKSISGVLGGASAGAMIGGAMTGASAGPIGAAIGGALGLAASFF
jgi:hypothetical protein